MQSLFSSSSILALLAYFVAVVLTYLALVIQSLLIDLLVLLLPRTIVFLVLYLELIGLGIAIARVVDNNNSYTMTVVSVVTVSLLLGVWLTSPSQSAQPISPSVLYKPPVLRK